MAGVSSKSKLEPFNRWLTGWMPSLRRPWICSFSARERSSCRAWANPA